jgi:hypothetical protein
MFMIIACNNSKQDALDYNNVIINDQIEFYNIHDSLFALFAENASADQCQMMYDSLRLYTGSLLSKYDTIQHFEGGQKITESMTVFLESYQTLILHEYNQILTIVTKPAYFYEAVDIVVLDSLYLIAAEKQQAIDATFTKEQELFISEFGLSTVDK